MNGYCWLVLRGGWPFSCVKPCRPWLVLRWVTRDNSTYSRPLGTSEYESHVTFSNSERAKKRKKRLVINLGFHWWTHLCLLILVWHKLPITQVIFKEFHIKASTKQYVPISIVVDYRDTDAVDITFKDMQNSHSKWVNYKLTSLNLKEKNNQGGCADTDG